MLTWALTQQGSRDAGAPPIMIVTSTQGRFSALRERKNSKANVSEVRAQFSRHARLPGLLEDRKLWRPAGTRPHTQKCTPREVTEHEVHGPPLQGPPPKPCT